MDIGQIMDIYCTYTGHRVRLLLGKSPTTVRQHLAKRFVNRPAEHFVNHPAEHFVNHPAELFVGCRMQKQVCTFARLCKIV